MTFWSGEKLKERLPKLLGEYYDQSMIDCNAYTMRVGNECFITPSAEKRRKKTDNEKIKRSFNESFSIPSGQFAFLITDEYIGVPHDAMAFISIKANTKLRGLINVSGFHVDPGYYGRLVFSVYNSSPSEIKLTVGQPLFLIWYADLDRDSSETKKYLSEHKPGYEHIDAGILNSISGKVRTLDEMAEEQKELRDKVENLKVAWWSMVTLLIAFLALIATMVAPLVPEHPWADALLDGYQKNQNDR